MGKAAVMTSAGTGTWLDQIDRAPNLDDAISSFVGQINFLRRLGLSNDGISRICRLNLIPTRRGPGAIR